MENTINLIHLKFFCDAVRYESISESAKVNYVTQSTVSQAISKLEITLGVQLISHSRKKLIITPEGQILFENARHVFKSLQDIRDKINVTKDAVNGTVRFVSISSLGMSFLPIAFQKMNEAYPQIDLQFKFGNPTFLRDSLRRDEVDFALIIDNLEFAQFSKIPLKKGQMNLYQHAEAPSYQIEKGILVDNEEGLFVDPLRNFIQESEHSNIRITELATWEMVARFVDFGYGVGWLPDYFLKNKRYPNLKPYPIKVPFIEYQICAAYNKGAKLSRASTFFLEQFVEAC